MKRKYVDMFALITTFLSVYILLFISCKGIAIDSDYSNLVLEANDILKGNLFLKGWTLTGISFITTDLLFFIIGALLKGISVGAYTIAITLMSTTLVCFSLLLIAEGKRLKWKHFLCVLLLLIPCQMDLFYLRAHTGSICWCFLAIFCVDRLLGSESTQSRKWYFVLTTALALGCVGDSLAILVGIFPIMGFSCICMLSHAYSGEQKKTARRVILACFLALCLSFILDKLYFLAGGCEKNSFLETKRFEPVENWWNKIYIYVRSIFMMHNADFFGKQLLSLQTIFFFINSLMVILGFLLTFKTIVGLLRGESTDAICSMLSVGFVVLSIIFIITNISIDTNSARYLGYVPLMFSILIVRNFAGVFTEVPNEWLKWCALACLLISCLGKGLEIKNPSDARPAQDGLGMFLVENGLKNGYGTFWNASSVSVLTGGEACIHAVYSNNARIEKYNWFCKSEWYREYSNFVVIGPTDGFNITEENVVSNFGAPADVLNYADYKILVYAYDISPLLYNGLDDNLILPHELFLNEYATRKSPHEIEMGKGTIIWGPYAHIEPGCYSMTYSGMNLNGMTYDIYSNSIGGNIPVIENSRSDSSIECILDIDKPLDDIEFREFNTTDEIITFSGILLQRIE